MRRKDKNSKEIHMYPFLRKVTQKTYRMNIRYKHLILEHLNCTCGTSSGSRIVDSKEPIWAFKGPWRKGKMQTDL